MTPLIIAGVALWLLALLFAWALACAAARGDGRGSANSNAAPRVWKTRVVEIPRPRHRAAWTAGLRRGHGGPARHHGAVGSLRRPTG